MLNSMAGQKQVAQGNAAATSLPYRQMDMSTSRIDLPGIIHRTRTVRMVAVTHGHDCEPWDLSRITLPAAED